MRTSTVNIWLLVVVVAGALGFKSAQNQLKIEISEYSESGEKNESDEHRISSQNLYWPSNCHWNRPLLVGSFLAGSKIDPLRIKLRNELGFDPLSLWPCSSKNPGLNLRLSGLRWNLLLSPDSRLDSWSSLHLAVMRFHFDLEPYLWLIIYKS